MNYVFALYFIIVGIVGVWLWYTLYKFIRYCKKHHPEEASKFLGFGTLFPLRRALFGKQEIGDPKFIVLQNKAKNAWWRLTIAFFGGIFLIFLILIGIAVIGR